MKDIKLIDFNDFYFNGHYLTEFGGMIGDTDGGKLTYPLLPTRNYTTGKPFNYNGEIVFATYLSPRTWEVPVFFEDLDYYGIRRIASWLDSEQATEFYFKGDTIRIFARLDTDAFFLDTINGIQGLTSLKFIAHDPYYYDIRKSVCSKQSPQSGQVYEFYNSGFVKTDSVIKVNGSGDIEVIIASYAGAEDTQMFTVKDVSGGFVVDTKAKVCIDGAGNNLFDKHTGAFPSLPPGEFTIRFNGNVTAFSVEFFGKYV